MYESKKLGRNRAKHATDYKKTYLFLYNLVLCTMFIKVSIVLFIKGLVQSVDDATLTTSSSIVKYLTYIQFVEVIHPMLGLVPGKPLMPLLQTSGRCLVNLLIADPGIRTAVPIYTYALMLVWSNIEIYRYSYYALRVFESENYILKWLRYTLFIPLYPAGGFLESMIVRHAATEYDNAGLYRYDLPNHANMSISLSFLMRFYAYFVLGAGVAFMMKYMWYQRCKALWKLKED